MENPHLTPEIMAAHVAENRRALGMPPQMESVSPSCATDSLDSELSRWQCAIRNLLCELTGDDGENIDGGGCDSGDPLDLTLTEIRQAWSLAQDQNNPSAPK